MSVTVTSLNDPVDPSECEREPIQFPGSIQPYGILLAFDRENLLVTHASENVGEYIGLSAYDLVGKSILTIIPVSDHEAFHRICANAGTDRIFATPLNVVTASTTASMVASIHVSGRRYILELEHLSQSDQTSLLVSLFERYRSMLVNLDAAQDVTSICEIAVQDIRELTGYDRVMAYRFDQDWNGVIVAESRAQGLPDFVGLNFPASDIPSQARALYAVTPVRMIVNRDYRPVPVFPLSGASSADPLDLSLSLLRSVSPIHIEYLTNMEVGATARISVYRGNKLWGLIACHHHSPNHVPYQVRQACELFSRILSNLIEQLEIKRERERTLSDTSLANQLCQSLAEKAMSYERAFIIDGSIRKLIPCDGVAILQGTSIVTSGGTPTPGQIAALHNWVLQRYPDESTVALNNLASVYPPAEEFREFGAGMIHLMLDPQLPLSIFFFRAEVVQTIRWAGNPVKAIRRVNGSTHLAPRHSFEVWSQVRHLQSLPWSSADVEAARYLGTLLRLLGHQQVDRADGQASFGNPVIELVESFSLMAAHEIKVPLRTISAYANVLKAEHGAALGPSGELHLTRITKLVEQIEQAIDRSAKASHSMLADMASEACDLKEIVEQQFDIVKASRSREGVTPHLVFGTAMPRISCNLGTIRSVITTLMENGIQYNRSSEPTVTVSCYRASKPLTIEGELINADNLRDYEFVVSDNGVGISEEQSQEIFHLFQKMQRDDDFGTGKGIGLSFAKRLLERSKGQIEWVPQIACGSQFRFSLAGA
jgi:light-regulated signal transduction histidine kinase (bacteriophytochrome)